MIRYVAGLILCTLLLYATALQNTYPSYRYVFDEFDIPSSYIDDPYFQKFVEKNEKKLYHFYRRVTRSRSELVRLLRQKLLENDVSDLFLYLSVIESGLRINAVSSKKAVGLWQFMPKTASDYHLNIDRTFDQRCDPLCATEAAIKHLRRLYIYFGKWYLAILAYNAGEGRVSKAIEKAGTDELDILIDPRRKYLPAETRQYIQRILLIAMIGESEMISIPVDEEKYELAEVEVSGGASLKKIAILLGMSEKKLISLNPAYVKGVVPATLTDATLLIPEEKLAAFYLKYVPQEQAETAESVSPYLVSHKVLLGETLGKIAKYYGSTVEQIRQVNRLEMPYLEVNSTLLIPIDKEYFDAILHQ